MTYPLQRHGGSRRFRFLTCPPHLLPAHPPKHKTHLQAPSRICPWKRAGPERSEAEIPTLAHPRAQFCNPNKLQSKFALSLRRTVLSVCVVLTAAVTGRIRDWIQLKNNPVKISNDLLPGVWAPRLSSPAHGHTRTHTGIGPTFHWKQRLKSV